MNLQYFKKDWTESSGEEITDSWGTSTFYFETNNDFYISRQIQFFANGKILKYDEQHLEDEFGFLSDQPLEIDEFINCEITKVEFDEIWNN